MSLAVPMEACIHFLLSANGPSVSAFSRSLKAPQDCPEAAHRVVIAHRMCLSRESSTVRAASPPRDTPSVVYLSTTCLIRRCGSCASCDTMPSSLRALTSAAASKSSGTPSFIRSCSAATCIWSMTASKLLPCCASRSSASAATISSTSSFFTNTASRGAASRGADTAAEGTAPAPACTFAWAALSLDATALSTLSANLASLFLKAA
mmetsp:Transcript_2505/g.5360  ORF Transcript_2505/g.5360 Transcript_2505/m.5360 type:complete len:207 (-) Transcript_2505:175-795(-)